MALSRRERALRFYESEMTEIFESLEWELYQDFKKADYRLAQIAKEALACGIPAEFREKFVRNKLVDMFQQIAEQREKSEKKKGG